MAVQAVVIGQQSPWVQELGQLMLLLVEVVGIERLPLMLFFRAHVSEYALCFIITKT